MTTSSIQPPPEQTEQRPQPDTNKQAEPVAPPKRRMMIIVSPLNGAQPIDTIVTALAARVAVLSDPRRYGARHLMSMGIQQRECPVPR